MRTERERPSPTTDATVPPGDPKALAVVDRDDPGGTPPLEHAAWPSTADGDWLRGVKDFAGFETHRKAR